jgi:hypothetical protein
MSRLGSCPCGCDLEFEACVPRNGDRPPWVECSIDHDRGDEDRRERGYPAAQSFGRQFYWCHRQRGWFVVAVTWSDAQKTKTEAA